MRVVIGEDQALLREGIVAPAGRGGLRGRRARPATPSTCAARSAPTSRTSRWSTSRCRRRAPTTGCARRSTSAPQHPYTRVLVLSQYIEERYAIDLIGECAEGVGYLLKDRVGDLDEFADAVRRVGEGGSVLDPEVVTRMLSRTRQRGPGRRAQPARARRARADGPGPLQPRASPRSSWITESAVEKHVTAIFEKLDLERDFEEHRRVLAVLDLPALAMTVQRRHRRSGWSALLQEQAALRRVAMLVARDVPGQRASSRACARRSAACSA